MSNKRHYDCIFLIIATNDTPYFNNSRKVWKQYIPLFPNIKFLFLYGKLDSPLDDKDENDLIFDTVIETYPRIYKTLIAFNYIKYHYTYNYVIRTNLSTFWNLNILDNILEKCPKEKCYAGGHDLSPFLINNLSNPVLLTTPLYSGVCIIITPDIIELFLNNLPKIDFSIADDLSIGLFLSDITCNTYTTHSKVYFENYTLLDNNRVEEEINSAIKTDVVYYRVKNENNRELTDLMIYRHLLKKIYNITFKD